MSSAVVVIGVLRVGWYFSYFKEKKKKKKNHIICHTMIYNVNCLIVSQNNFQVFYLFIYLFYLFIHFFSFWSAFNLFISWIWQYFDRFNFNLSWKYVHFYPCSKFVFAALSRIGSSREKTRTATLDPSRFSHPNGDLERAGDLINSSVQGLKKVSLYVLGEKTQMKVCILSLTMLWANSADDKLMMFSYFS